MARTALAALAVTIVMGTPADAATEQRAAIFNSLIGCRTVSADAERLACYDQKVAAIATAEQSGDLFVTDRSQARDIKASLFGFGPIRLPIFGARDNVPAPAAIDAKITGLRDLGYGKWEFTLDNGMRWIQTDSEEISPRVGQSVNIRTAAFGSFFLRVGNQHSVRAQRLR